MSAPAHAGDALLIGRAHVIDADTIRIGGVSVRLKGVAAPELSEPGGNAARSFLVSLVGSGVVECRLTGERTHGRAVGFCGLSGKDIGAELVAGGWALSCPRFSTRYVDLEPVNGTVQRIGYKLPEYCRRKP